VCLNKHVYLNTRTHSTYGTYLVFLFSECNCAPRCNVSSQYEYQSQAFDLRPQSALFRALPFTLYGNWRTWFRVLFLYASLHFNARNDLRWKFVALRIVIRAVLCVISPPSSVKMRTTRPGRGSKAFTGICLCVCVCVCEMSAEWFQSLQTWCRKWPSDILYTWHGFQVKRSKVKVTGSRSAKTYRRSRDRREFAPLSIDRRL